VRAGRRHGSIGLLLAALLACGGRPPPGAGPAPRGLLPDGAAPLGYRLELEIVPERESFEGEVAIELELARPLRVLWLYAQELRAREVELGLPGGARLPARLAPEGESGLAAVVLPRAAGPGRATLRIAWEAPLGRQLRGLYRVQAGGDAYAFSQFEPVAARLAFPGFDEPRFKTPFEVALRVRAEHAALSNAPALFEEDLGQGMKRVRFAPTPPLPTYLVAFAVGPLDLVEAPPLPPRARGLPPPGRNALLSRRPPARSAGR
jgi:alanyl aminopeptidase